MFEIDLSTDNNLAALARKLSSYQQPLEETGAYLENRAKTRFLTQKDPTGKAWAPLRPSTLRRKKTRAILRETGVMAASISWLVSGATVRVRPSVDYALLHQLGAKRMPARPFMGFESGDPAAIGKIFRGYIEG